MTNREIEPLNALRLLERWLERDVAQNGADCERLRIEVAIRTGPDEESRL